MSQIVFVGEAAVTKKRLKKLNKQLVKLLGIGLVPTKSAQTAADCLDSLVEQVFAVLRGRGDSRDMRKMSKYLVKASYDEELGYGDVDSLIFDRKMVRLIDFLVTASGHNHVTFWYYYGIHIVHTTGINGRSQEWSLQQPRYPLDLLDQNPELMKNLNRGEKEWIRDMGDRNWCSGSRGDLYLRLWSELDRIVGG